MAAFKKKKKDIYFKVPGPYSELSYAHRYADLM